VTPSKIVGKGYGGTRGGRIIVMATEAKENFLVTSITPLSNANLEK
jgi:hypothetical protein